MVSVVSLFAAAFAAAAADCLNPVAITQQFILQGMVRKKGHIWAFILAVYITNFLGGLLFYLGVDSLIQTFWAPLAVRFEPLVLTGQLILSVVLFFYAGFFPQKWQLESLQNQVHDLTRSDVEQREKEAAKKKVKSVHPMYLALLGSVNVILELPTALPYFTFLAVLLSADPPLILTLLLLLFYNIIFTLPLAVLHWLYTRCQNRVERFYLSLKDKIHRLLRIVIPLLFFTMGSILLFQAVCTFFI